MCVLVWTPFDRLGALTRLILGASSELTYTFPDPLRLSGYEGHRLVPLGHVPPLCAIDPLSGWLALRQLSGVSGALRGCAFWYYLRVAPSIHDSPHLFHSQGVLSRVAKTA